MVFEDESLKAKRLDVLLRVSAELFARSNRIKEYVSQIDVGELKEHQQLVDTINAALIEIERIVANTLQTGKTQIAVASLQSHNKTLLSIFSNLKRFSRWFITIHELLVYLPRKSAVRETFYTIEEPFGETYRQQEPSIILGSIFNAFEFDFLQVLKKRLPDLNQIILKKSRNVVLQLALCDRDSPLTWPILAHEMGHAIDSVQGISQSIANMFVKNPESKAYKIVRSWSGELCADMIATHTFGPSAILALMTMELCIYPTHIVYVPSEKHPLTKWRLEVVSDYMKYLNDGEDLIPEEKSFYNSTWLYQIELFESRPQKREEILKWEYERFRDVIIPIYNELKKFVPSLGLRQHSFSKEEIDRCKRRLMRESPIGAQGADRKDLRKEIDIYRAETEQLPPGKNRAGRFQELIAKFNESPVLVPMIVYSGYQARQDIVEEFVANAPNADVMESSKLMCEQLNQLDALLANSIRASSVCQRIIDSPHC